MALDGEHKTYPTGLRPITVAEDRTQIERAFEEATKQVARMGPSATTRTLKVALAVFKHDIEQWSTDPPTQDQIALMREHLAEVLLLARSNARTVKLRRSA
jgi:hypothetical protein